jgi:hypothetical protein
MPSSAYWNVCKNERINREKIEERREKLRT